MGSSRLGMTDGILLTYPSREIDRPAYLARPSTEEPRPGLLVIHEIFGLSPHIQDVARRLGDQVYGALAPDLFAHGGRPVTNEQLESAMRLMRSLPPESRRNPEAAQAKVAEIQAADRGPTQKALDWLRNRDLDAHTPDMLAAVDVLTRQPFVRQGRIGSWGFCIGGALSVRLAAAGAPVGGGVIFYWGPPPLPRVPPLPRPG